MTARTLGIALFVALVILVVANRQVRRRRAHVMAGDGGGSVPWCTGDGGYSGDGCHVVAPTQAVAATEVTTVERAATRWSGSRAASDAL